MRRRAGSSVHRRRRPPRGARTSSCRAVYSLLQKTRSDTYLIGDVEFVSQFGREFDKLVKGDIPQHFRLVPFLPKGTVEGVDEVSGLFDSEIQEGVDMPFGAVVVIDEVIADRGHELIAGDDLNELGVLRRFV